MASWRSVPLLGPPCCHARQPTRATKGGREEVRSAPSGRERHPRATIGERLLHDDMELSDFVIGETFWTHGGAFRCTDIGTRVVVAVKLGPREIARAESLDGEVRITKRIDDDAGWLTGPPYGVEELVFDENELMGCFRSEAELLGDGEHD